ncbi:MAG: hypothetical protein KG003_11290 [Bacteroidetes bacterium]|nr:hypothetical protein [Bacteroidota bacterium]
MKKILILFSLFFCLFPHQSKAQDSTSQKYLGFDANPMLSQFLPFNRVVVSSNTFAVTTRRYWGRHGLRASYGVGLGDALDVNFLQFMLGYDYRVPLNKHWYYFNGVDLLLRFSEDLSSNFPVATGDAQGIGIGGHWGVEYAFNKVISVSSEASLRMMVDPGNDDASFILVPPINLTVHFNISKK